MTVPEDDIADILDEYLRDLPARFANVDNALGVFEITCDEGQLREAISEAHRLRGTGKLFGQTWVSEIAGRMEDHLKAMRAGKDFANLSSMRFMAKVAVQVAKSCRKFNNITAKEDSDVYPAPASRNSVSGRTHDFGASH